VQKSGHTGSVDNFAVIHVMFVKKDVQQIRKEGRVMIVCVVFVDFQIKQVLTCDGIYRVI